MNTISSLSLSKIYESLSTNLPITISSENLTVLKILGLTGVLILISWAIYKLIKCLYHHVNQPKASPQESSPVTNPASTECKKETNADNTKNASLEEFSSSEESDVEEKALAKGIEIPTLKLNLSQKDKIDALLESEVVTKVIILSSAEANEQRDAICMFVNPNTKNNLNILIQTDQNDIAIDSDKKFTYFYREGALKTKFMDLINDLTTIHGIHGHKVKANQNFDNIILQK